MQKKKKKPKTFWCHFCIWLFENMPPTIEALQRKNCAVLQIDLSLQWKEVLKELGKYLEHTGTYRAEWCCCPQSTLIYSGPDWMGKKVSNWSYIYVFLLLLAFFSFFFAS